MKALGELIMATKQLTFWLTALLVTSFFSVAGQSKFIAVTIDDLPTVTYGKVDSTYHQLIISNLIEALKEYQVPGIGFVNEVKLYKGEKPITYQTNLLKDWMTSGFALVNHTFSHADYNEMSMHAFAAEILQGEKITREIVGAAGKKLTYFRHPYLHTGNTKARSDSLEAFLRTHTYQVAPVTIDNEDYLFAAAYQPARDNSDLMLTTDIIQDYIKYMEAKLVYFERQSVRLFGRNINQVLLIHANRLNADCLGALAQMYRRHGYEFVTLEKALTDPAYTTPVTAFGKWGISWIDRWAMSQGKSKDFFAGEPETPAYIKTLAAGIPK